MNQALSTFVPLYAFMLLPVWIPMIAVSVGWVLDRFGSVTWLTTRVLS